MAFIPVPNTIKLSFEWLVAGQIVAVTLSVEKASAVTVADLDTVNDMAVDWWNTDSKALQTATSTLTRTTSTDLTTSSSPVADNPITPIAGTAAGNPLPNNAALVVSFKTANRGRSYRGRMYWPGIPQSQQLNPVTVQSAYAIGLATSVAAFLDDLDTAGYTPVVVSRQEDNVVRTTGVTTPITTLEVEQFIDSQRRRLAGRGI